MKANIRNHLLFDNINTIRRHLAVKLVAQVAVSVVLCSISRAELTEDTVISRLDPGSMVTTAGVQGWSHVVMVATPKITSGDVDNVSEMIRRYAAKFSTVIAADVLKSDRGYRLQRIGIGIAVADGVNFRIVSGRRDAGGPPDEFGMIDRQVLRAAENSLAQVKLTLRHSFAMFLDSPAIVSVNQSHQELLARHLVWVNPKSGHLSSAVWFVRTGRTPEVVDQQGVFLPANFRETRRLHVDTGEFIFGIPGARAFAMEGLPPGKPFPLPKRIAASASAAPLTIQDLSVIANHLSAIAGAP